MIPVRWRVGRVVVAAATVIAAAGVTFAGPVKLEPNPFRSLFVEAYAAAPFDPNGPPPAPNLQNKPFTGTGRVNDSNSATQSFRGDDGFRSDAAPLVYSGLRLLCLGLFFAGSLAIFVPGRPFGWFMIQGVVIVTGVGFYLPSLILWYIRSKRQEEIFLTLPDALDLLVV